MSERTQDKISLNSSTYLIDEVEPRPRLDEILNKYQEYVRTEGLEAKTFKDPVCFRVKYLKSLAEVLVDLDSGYMFIVRRVFTDEEYYQYTTYTDPDNIKKYRDVLISLDKSAGIIIPVLDIDNFNLYLKGYGTNERYDLLKVKRYVDHDLWLLESLLRDYTTNLSFPSLRGTGLNYTLNLSNEVRYLEKDTYVKETKVSVTYDVFWSMFSNSGNNDKGLYASFILDKNSNAAFSILSDMKSVDSEKHFVFRENEDMFLFVARLLVTLQNRYVGYDVSNCYSKIFLEKLLKVELTSSFFEEKDVTADHLAEYFELD